MANYKHHVCTNIEGLLRNMKGKKINFFENDKGGFMSDREVREEIAKLQALGHKLIPSADCEGFDPFGGGCPGHLIEEETDAEHKLPKKALTVKNPWAWLIAQGIKDIENRTWRTNFRGRVLIHAAAQMDHRHREMSLLFSREQWHELSVPNSDKMISGTFPMSEILCSVEIVDCVMDHPSVWAESGKTEEGKQIWNWVLANPQPEPNFAGLKIKGALSFWDFTQERIIGKEATNV